MKIKKIIGKIIHKSYPKILYVNKNYYKDGEDMVLKSFFERDKNYKGFYVDIGAHHPFRFSNTAYFYKKGWSGINIEPTPTLINDFYKFRKRDINLNIAIANTNKQTLKFFFFNEPALNSFDEELSLSRNHGKYKIIGTTEIAPYKLSDVLDKYLEDNKKIDFFSIDVEGLDLEVLKSNNWDKYVPNFIIVEINNCNIIEENDTHKFLIDKNYKLVGMTIQSCIYKHKNAAL